MRSRPGATTGAILSRRKNNPPRPDCLGCDSRSVCKKPCEEADRYASQDKDRIRKVHVTASDGRKIRIPRIIYEHQLPEHGRSIYDEERDKTRKHKKRGGE